MHVRWAIGRNMHASEDTLCFVFRLDAHSVHELEGYASHNVGAWSMSISRESINVRLDKFCIIHYRVLASQGHGDETISTLQSMNCPMAGF